MKFTSILAEIFFPRLCLGCGMRIKTGTICSACLASIPVNNAFFCGECGSRLPIAMQICHPKVPCLMGAAGSYDNPALKALIHNLKFRNARGAAEVLAELIARFLSDMGQATSDKENFLHTSSMPPVISLSPDNHVACRMSQFHNYIIIPIPLSKQRELERGYNQAAEIAAKLALKLSLPFATDILLKTAHTKPQTETKDIKERRENLSGCFAIKNPAAVAGKKILLVDDVTTSGSTFLEAARILKAAGARKIIAIAAARA
jgi:ComF family protein